MMKKSAVLSGVATVLLSANGAHALYPACPDGLDCITVTPPDKPQFTFNCSIAAPGANASELGFVYFMHGDEGQYSKAIWADPMRQLADLGYSSVACDQRGYSVGASPYNYDAYNYNELAGDIFSIVNATYGTGKFHLVAHDQGARISWHALATRPEARERFLSFSTLSIPHSDVFSDALYGPNAYEPQQQASQCVFVTTLRSGCTPCLACSAGQRNTVAAYSAHSPTLNVCCIFAAGSPMFRVQVCARLGPA